jgi:hypothetical protein
MITATRQSITNMSAKEIAKECQQAINGEHTPDAHIKEISKVADGIITHSI